MYKRIFSNNLVRHFFVFLIFSIISVIYFSPVLQGKKLYQHDIAQHVGMARQINDYRINHGREIRWTDTAFGGMPTYQIGALYDYNYVKKIDRLFRFLPRPADYLFLYLCCFYLLMFTLTGDSGISFLGALAFGFSTYLIIIIGAGHNSKAHAIAYMPLVLSGILLVFKKRFLFGFLVTSIALSLQIGANHYQMTFYLMILVIVLGICNLIDAIYRKQLRSFFLSILVLIPAVAVAVGMNSSSILATQEYVEYSTRGSSDLTISPEGTFVKNSSGLSNDDITRWSYGIVESFNLLIPNFMGGKNFESLDKTSETYKVLLKQGASKSQASSIVKTSIPTYWGEQPGVSGPAYIGASVLFLFFLALFLVKGKMKWWLLVGSILALLLSYGKNFNLLTNFFIEYFPLYNKFRAITSIQVIAELCVPILGILGLKQIFDFSIDNVTKLKALKYAFIFLAGIILFFLLFKSEVLDFSTLRDMEYEKSNGSDLMEALKADRKKLFTSDSLRSLALISVCAGILLLYLKSKLTKNVSMIALAIVILFDLVIIDKRYVSISDFHPARNIETPFKQNLADVEILDDKSHYRVYDLNSGFFSARASYFHNSIGGYSAVQPKLIQDLHDFHIAKGNQEVLNMLNVKYFIYTTKKGKISAYVNSQINGNAWFIENLSLVKTANEEILELDSVNTKNVAILNVKDWENYSKELVEIGSLNRNVIPSYIKNENAKIILISHDPEHLIYQSSNRETGFAVFSENFYKPGWQAYIDGKAVPHLRVDYALRGLIIPSGEHKIEFKFFPKVIQMGNIITLTSFILLLILGLIYAYFSRKKLVGIYNNS